LMIYGKEEPRRPPSSKGNTSTLTFELGDILTAQQKRKEKSLTFTRGNSSSAVEKQPPHQGYKLVSGCDSRDKGTAESLEKGSHLLQKKGACKVMKLRRLILEVERREETDFQFSGRTDLLPRGKRGVRTP